ncbi:ATP-binding protein [Lutispora thermophila]|uniref:Histidine kinase-, DNA gyrase B-, and HSP90-like ATPase n=1 Tax=Lutispora thermophila DSM 19022 TaxID=1122184 RepID=A0A1M6FRR2_9FIRM|nr:ATP-binding protein [Lutispora thermophila]SHJ00320.1 Histidine kinase-, DNA gyrase B-, and HSP90-like ATPase [Lutispora thermophila DSM 19022]
MKELSLHILDIVQNSIAADANLIDIKIVENLAIDKLIIEVADNGRGMEEEMTERVKDPFVTGRKTRKVGLGIPLLYEACTRCGGDLRIESEIGKGTKVICWFKHSHIDRAPLGNMIDTILTLIMGNPHIDITYLHIIDEREMRFDTREVRKVLGEVPINEPQVLSWIRDYLKEGFNSIYGGANI